MIDLFPTFSESRDPNSSTPAAVHAVDQLLRDPAGILERIREGRDLQSLARAMILTIVVGAGLFGASMGLFRGGLQILYAATKLPLVLLLTTAICAPALTTLNSALGRPACIRRDLSLVLCSLGRMSLVTAAEAPLVLLAIRHGISYHSIVVLVVLCCAVGGAVGLALFMRGLRASASTPVISVALALLTVFGLVGTQVSWTLRPYLVRPRADVAFMRGVEGNFFEAVGTSARSAEGVYSRQYAPLPGEADVGGETR